MSCIAHGAPSHPVPSQEVPGCHPTHPREEGTKGEAEGDPWPRKAKRDRSAAGRSRPHLWDSSPVRYTTELGRTNSISVWEGVGRWASGWALLNVHSSQRGWPARKVDKRHPESQKAELEALSSTGRTGKAPRETRVPWITGGRLCRGRSTGCRRVPCHGAWVFGHPGSPLQAQRGNASYSNPPRSRQLGQDCGLQGKGVSPT